jgi:L-iditol 2-dehydrogenase
LSYEEAALNEPLSCCYHGSLACRIVPGDTVVVIGAGPIGILHAQLARLSGARLVMLCETSPQRLAAALQYGVDLGVNPVEEDALAFVRRHTEGRGVDVVIVAASSGAAQELAIEMLAHHGRVNLFGGLPPGNKGITFPSNVVHYRHLTVTGTTGSSTYEYRRSLALLAAGRIKVANLISTRYPLTQIHEALEVARSGQALKIVLLP